MWEGGHFPGSRKMQGGCGFLEARLPAATRVSFIVTRQSCNPQKKKKTKQNPLLACKTLHDLALDLLGIVVRADDKVFAGGGGRCGVYQH